MGPQPNRKENGALRNDPTDISDTNDIYSTVPSDRRTPEEQKRANKARERVQKVLTSEQTAKANRSSVDGPPKTINTKTRRPVPKPRPNRPNKNVNSSQASRTEKEPNNTKEKKSIRDYLKDLCPQSNYRDRDNLSSFLISLDKDKTIASLKRLEETGNKYSIEMLSWAYSDQKNDSNKAYLNVNETGDLVIHPDERERARNYITQLILAKAHVRFPKEAEMDWNDLDTFHGFIHYAINKTPPMFLNLNSIDEFVKDLITGLHEAQNDHKQSNSTEGFDSKSFFSKFFYNEIFDKTMTETASDSNTKGTENNNTTALATTPVTKRREHSTPTNPTTETNGLSLSSTA